MGAWGTGSFDNDDAADWFATLLEQQDLVLVGKTIDELLAIHGYIEAPEASRALAAIETLVAALGRPTAIALANDDLTAWLQRAQPRADAEMTSNAIAAIDRIAGADSELCELWEESAACGEWQAGVATLRERLLNPAPGAQSSS